MTRPSAARDATIAARVPVDLKTDLEALLARDRARDPDATMTTVLRRLLRRAADDELVGRPTAGERLFAGGRGAARGGASPTAKAAASRVAPRIGSQRRLCLEVFGAAGIHGATTDEVIHKLEVIFARTRSRPPAVNGIARRVTDLLQAGAIAAVPDPFTGLEPPMTRTTRHGVDAQVYAITSVGRRWLEQVTG